MTRNVSKHKYPPRIKGSNTDPDSYKEMFSIKLLEKENTAAANETANEEEYSDNPSVVGMEEENKEESKDTFATPQKNDDMVVE